MADITAQQVLHWSRNHWGIENNLHWVLDIAFGEDGSKVSAGQGPINLATIRKLAMRIIQEDKQMKGSFRTKRKIAGRLFIYSLPIFSHFLSHILYLTRNIFSPASQHLRNPIEPLLSKNRKPGRVDPSDTGLFP